MDSVRINKVGSAPSQPVAPQRSQEQSSKKIGPLFLIAVGLTLMFDGGQRLLTGTATSLSKSMLSLGLASVIAIIFSRLSAGQAPAARQNPPSMASSGPSEQKSLSINKALAPQSPPKQTPVVASSSDADKTKQQEEQLIEAADKGDLKAVQDLFKAGAKMDKLSRALFVATLGGHIPVVEFFLDNGADVNDLRFHNYSPLETAASQGHLPMVEFLVGRGAKVSSLHENRSGQYGTPLAAAIMGGKIEVMNYLISKGADINELASDAATRGLSPLEIAVKNGQLNAADILLVSGATYRSKDGLLDIAHQTILDRLKQTLADHETPAPQSPPKQTPVVASSASPEKAKQQEKQLIEAADKGDLKAVQDLFKAGAKMDKFSKALHAAVMAGHIPVVEFFLDNGMDVNDLSCHNCCPLMSAAGEGRLPMVEFLVGRGAKVNSLHGDLSCQHTTPLAAAVLSGHVHIMNFLIRNNADVNESTSDGSTHRLSPLEIAARKGQLDAAEILLGAGASYRKNELLAMADGKIVEGLKQALARHEIL